MRVAVGFGVGPVRLWAPCEIVWVLQEPDRYGWGYGALPGHPVSGEEAWLVSIGADERVYGEVRAFSRPARWFARLGGPVTRLAQRGMTERYLRALAASG